MAEALKGKVEFGGYSLVTIDVLYYYLESVVYLEGVVKEASSAMDVAAFCRNWARLPLERNAASSLSVTPPSAALGSCGQN